jgi:hypothetical protein
LQVFSVAGQATAKGAVIIRKPGRLAAARLLFRARRAEQLTGFDEATTQGVGT